MKYLLDTNVIIDYLRGRYLLPQSVIEAGSGISVITLSELKYGAYNSDDPDKSLTELMNTFMDLGLEIINLNEKIADVFGKLKAKLMKKGKIVDNFDLLIASTVIENKLILVTGNLKHFSRIESLKIYKN